MSREGSCAVAGSVARALRRPRRDSGRRARRPTRTSHVVSPKAPRPTRRPSTTTAVMTRRASDIRQRHCLLASIPADRVRHLRPRHLFPGCPETRHCRGRSVTSIEIGALLFGPISHSVCFAAASRLSVLWYGARPSDLVDRALCCRRLSWFVRPTGLADRPRQAGVTLSPAVRATGCGASPRSGSSKPRTTPRSSPSPTRNAPGSTSSPTGRCGGRATRTASPPPSRRRHRQSRHRPRPQRTPQPGSAGRRPGRRKHPVQVGDLEFLRARTDRTVKITVPGPFTMSQQAQNDYYDSDDELAVDNAAAVNEEIVDLFAAGADIVQVDEPYMQAARQGAGVRAAGARPGPRRSHRNDRCHICFGYAAIIHERPEGYSFLPELAARTSIRSRSRPPSRTSTRPFSSHCRARRSSSASSISTTRRSSRRRWSPNGSAAPLPTYRPTDRRRPRLRHEIPPTRRRLRQAAGDGRRRGAVREELGSGPLTPFTARLTVSQLAA